MKPMRGFGYKELHEFYLNDPTSDGNGELQMGELLEVTVNCNYNLVSFPFDSQECDFSLYAEADTVESAIFNESTKSICYKGKCHKTRIIYLPQQYGIEYKIAMVFLGLGNFTMYNSTYTCSTIRFSLQRNSIDLLLGSFYIPTGIFGFLSMASYIMNPETVSIVIWLIYS